MCVNFGIVIVLYLRSKVKIKNGVFYAQCTIPKRGKIQREIIEKKEKDKCNYYVEESVLDRENIGGAKHAAKALSKLFTISVIVGRSRPCSMTQSTAR